MTLAQRLAEYVRACFTGLWIESHEHPDALVEITALCRQEEWHLATWDIEAGLVLSGHTTTLKALCEQFTALGGEAEATLRATPLNRDAQFALLYGLGEGHFEVSLARFTVEGFEILAQNGSMGLGGHVWTERIAQYVREQIRAKSGGNVEWDAWQAWRLYSQCEQAKKRLGRENSVQIPVHLAGEQQVIELSQGVFEDLTADLLVQTAFIAGHVLDDAYLT